MTTLDPLFAANLASDIYDIKDEFTRKVFHAKYKKNFDLGEDSSLESKGLTGKTGCSLLKTSHMMGLVAEGLPKSQYENQAIFAVKGTASLMDALTDLNAGIKNSRTGGNVHQGFQDTFTTFVDDLPSFSANINTVHCVGHSLGGALATLTADWFKSNTGRNVKLYTYGSPRVGLDFYANKAERKIGNDNIFRVYHKTDPVAMVPTWPFTHVTTSGKGEYLLPSSAQLKLWEPHLMKNYKKSLKSSSGTELGWDELKALRPQGLLDSTVEAWLRSDGPISFTINTASMVGAALLWVVEKIAHLTGIAVVLTGGTIFTVLDRLAYLMHKAADLIKDASFWVTRLIKRMAQLLGLVLVEGTNVTHAFIRTVFIQMHHAVSEMVRQAGRHLE